MYISFFRKDLASVSFLKSWWSFSVKTFVKESGTSKYGKEGKQNKATTQRTGSEPTTAKLLPWMQVSYGERWGVVDKPR